MPLISVIVPNFNGEGYLNECLNSITGQNYPNLELLVIDGGSSDNSLSIIRSYSDYVSTLISEPDRGQSHAINKGLRIAQGEIVVYVNSDDLMEPLSLHTVGAYFSSNRDVNWLAGSCRVFGEDIETWLLRPQGWSRLIDTVMPWQRLTNMYSPSPAPLS